MKMNTHSILPFRISPAASSQNSSSNTLPSLQKSTNNPSSAASSHCVGLDGQLDPDAAIDVEGEEDDCSQIDLVDDHELSTDDSEEREILTISINCYLKFWNNII